MFNFFKEKFNNFKETVSNTASALVGNVVNAAGQEEEFSEFVLDDMEDTLISADLGVNFACELVDKLRNQTKIKPSDVKEYLKDEFLKTLKDAGSNELNYKDGELNIYFIAGVNGVGKTTSIGKLASQFKNDGKRVIIAAADTFRAAAGDQLKVWADRAGCELISGKEGADPSSVLFDAVAAARARRADILLVDTAGRLNNKKNLMNELSKMNKIIDKNYPEAHRENFIVLDATTGQNALQQALAFNEVSDLTGIILTKMDGTAKGGIAVAIQSSLHVPVKYIGVGEKIEDLQKFDEKAYVKALFERDKEETAEA